MPKIRKLELPIPPKENPFEHDLFNRKPHAEMLRNLVLNSPSPFVVSVNGGWGTGKTSFLKMWQQMLENGDEENGVPKVPTVYFSAWESDFSDNALIPILGEIQDSLKAHVEDTAFTKFVEATKGLGRLVKGIFYKGLKYITQQDIEADVKDVQDRVEAKDGWEKSGEELINDYSSTKETISEF